MRFAACARFVAPGFPDAGFTASRFSSVRLAATVRLAAVAVATVAVAAAGAITVYVADAMARLGAIAVRFAVGTFAPFEQAFLAA